MIDWHLFSSPVHRHELDVCPGIDHWRELREVEPVPLSQPFDEDILFLLEFVEGADGLAEVVFRSDRLAHPSFRQLNHGGVQQVAAVAEVLGFEERRAYRRAGATPSLEAGVRFQKPLPPRPPISPPPQGLSLLPPPATGPGGPPPPPGQHPPP